MDLDLGSNIYSFESNNATNPSSLITANPYFNRSSPLPPFFIPVPFPPSSAFKFIFFFGSGSTMRRCCARCDGGARCGAGGVGGVGGVGGCGVVVVEDLAGGCWVKQIFIKIT